MPESDPVEVTFSLNPDDVVASYVAVYRVNDRWRGFRPVVATLLLVLGPIDGLLGLPWVLAGLVMAIGALLVLPLSVHFRRPARRFIRDNPWLSRPITVRLDDDGIRVRGDGVRNELDWVWFPYYQETDAGFLLRVSTGRRGMFHILPRRAFAGPDEVARLRALLDRHCTRLAGRGRRPSGQSPARTAHPA